MTERCVHDPLNIADTFKIVADANRPFAIGGIGSLPTGMSEIRVCKLCSCLYVHWGLGHSDEDKTIPKKDLPYQMGGVQ